MPPKKKKRSRSNSLVERKSETESLLRSSKKLNSLKAKKRSSLEEETFLGETEAGEEIECRKSKDELKMPLSKTSLLIQDYLEFKAARCIQRFVRGWLYRTKYRRKRLAAIKLQAEWRRFYCQRMYFRKVEETLQERIEQHFYRAAQKIQALWRGWWVRHHIHDFSRLHNLQLLAGEDLLYCVAFKLHHLLRTHHIPGVYSLRNSNALSKVEQLLASIRFKHFNQRSLEVMHQKRQEKKEAKKQHQESAFGTKIPFKGPNICTEKALPLYTTKDADLRMSKILQTYEEVNREISKPKVLRKKAVLSQQSTISIPPSKSSSFCSDVVRSMKKWKILTENNLSVDPNVWNKPQNVESFLKEVKSKIIPSQDDSSNICEFGNEKERLRLLCTKYNSQKSNSKVNLPTCAEISSVTFTVDEPNLTC